MFRRYLSQIDEIIEDARAGRMMILVDDEDRENEGDLYIPAEKCTPEAINFMAKHGRGLICLSMTRERVEELGLPLMARDNSTRHQTAFTVSIEAREGVTTGISAADRAHTIKVAIDPSKGARDIGSPGHVFPLMARDGGTLVRAGHTEAAVDIARLAGLNPSGVICEIMNDDGTMARLPDLVKFAQFHGLKVATIADLIAYRRLNDNLVRREVELDVTSRWGGDFRVIVYRNVVDHVEHIALVKGDVRSDEPVLVRVHAMQFFHDILGSTSMAGSSLHGAMKVIGETGRGAVVIIREAGLRPLGQMVKSFREGQPTEYGVLRDYGVGAQILLDLGIKNMMLLTNKPRDIVGLEGYGLKVVGTRPTPKVEGD
jgi:3,4-dihydroxy 2-butanone 4-phosphate synthase/GTP cyclohydrolase II